MEVVHCEDRRGRAPVDQYVAAIVAAGDGAARAQLRRGLQLLAEFGQAVGMPHTRMIDRTARMYELRFGDHRVATSCTNSASSSSTVGESEASDSTSRRPLARVEAPTIGVSEHEGSGIRNGQRRD